jgi:hypothetical protein
MRIATAIRSLVLAAAVSIIPAASYAGVFVSIGIGAPPVLPVYAQPICPAPGYIWTPGYWAYDDEAGYYWVPGAWVLAPYTGALWTPGYWGWGDGGYFWHAGYWGPHVGFYGGVNYGFGYFGRGFEGGYWDHDRFRYNTAIMHVDHDRFRDYAYERRIDVRNDNRVSFNGGRGGVQMRPNGDEERWAREQHTAPLAAQHQNEMRASQDRAQFANVNHGRPENLQPGSRQQQQRLSSAGKHADEPAHAAAGVSSAGRASDLPAAGEPADERTYATAGVPRAGAAVSSAGEPADEPACATAADAPGTPAAGVSRRRWRRT